MIFDNHVAPDQEAIERNKSKEPFGEQARAELIAWMDKFKIVSVALDTEEHSVQIDIRKLPPEIKPILTHWGSIYVRNEYPATGASEAEGKALLASEVHCQKCHELLIWRGKNWQHKDGLLSYDCNKSPHCSSKSRCITCRPISPS